MQRQLQAFADRTTRYIRIYQLPEPGSWQAAGDVEHAAILDALITRDEQGALTEHALWVPGCRGGHPGRAGGLWVCRILVLSGFHAVVVPSGFRTSVQPHR